MLKKHVFLLAFIFSFNFLISQNAFADSYFSRILSGMSGRNLDTHEQAFATTNELPVEKINTFGFLKNIFRPVTNLQIFQKPQDTTPATIDRETNNQFLDNTNNPYFENPAPQIVTTQNASNIQNSTTSTSTTKQSDSYLSIILQKLGILSPTPTPNPLNSNSPTIYSNTYSPQTPYFNPQTGQYQSKPVDPNTQNQQNTLGNFLNTPGGSFGGQPGGQFGQGGQNPGANNNNFGGNGGGVERYQAGQPLGSGPQNLATPYTGPGGALPGDCGIPKGPIANNIGSENGSGVRCEAKTTMVGFMGTIQSLPANMFGGGYFNPILEKGQERNYPGEVAASAQTQVYGEYKFKDYNSSSAKTYIDKQILHWRQQALSRKQKCIPIDLDNCDSIGPVNTKIVLDRIEESNAVDKNGGAIIKVFLKNPQNNSCNGGGNLMTHPAVIGGFTEEVDSPQDIENLIKMRKPEQILMFVAGTGSKTPGDKLNQNVKNIESKKIPNSAYSYDSGCEYCIVHNCTYNQ